MRIGRLDRRITLTRLIETTQSYNDTWGAQTEQSSNANDRLTLWSTKLDKPVGERAELGKDVSIMRTEFTTRFIDGSLHGFIFERCGSYVINYNSKTYEVKGFEELGRKEGMKFHTEIRR
jgi:hypothetical protein